MKKYDDIEAFKEKAHYPEIEFMKFEEKKIKSISFWPLLDDLVKQVNPKVTGDFTSFSNGESVFKEEDYSLSDKDVVDFLKNNKSLSITSYNKEV